MKLPFKGSRTGFAAMAFASAAMALSACVPNGAPSTGTPVKSVAEPQSPYYVPGICRRILIEASSVDAVKAELERALKNVVTYRYGIYKMKNGKYAGAEAFEVIRDRNEAIKHRTVGLYKETLREAQASIQRQINNGGYHPTARCTDGSDIAIETGIWYNKVTQTDGALGLMVLAVSGVSKAMSEAQSAPAGGVQSYSPVASDETKQPVGVKVDGDGWVSENGKKIGRVEVSYGYNILCSNGYNYGSDSVFGGSFKADVNSMDEAVVVVLSACKR